MLSQGPAKKVTIYVNEDARYHGAALYEAVLEYLMHKGVAGATASRALAGYGAHRVLHTPRIELLAEHLPVRIEFVESPSKTDGVLPGLYEMVGDGLIEVQDTTVVKAVQAASRTGAKLLRERRQERAQMLRIFLGEADQWEGEPLFDAIVKRLRMLEIAGATVYRGILGYGAKGHTHQRSFWHPMRDLPVLITVVDTPENVNRAAEAVEAMVEDGLLVISDVEMTRLLHRMPENADVPVSNR